MNLSPLWISLKIAFTASSITFFTGLFAAWLCSKAGKFRPLIDALFSLPLVLPPTVIGFILLMLFSGQGAPGAFLLKIGVNFLFTWQGAVLAAVAVSFPVMYRTTRAAFDQIDRNIIFAARTLGMNEFSIFVKIMIPLSLPGIAAALILSFARALGEFGATIMIAGNIAGKTQTMAVAVYTAMQAGNKELAFRWVLIILSISLLILLFMNFWTEIYGKRRFCS